MELDGIAEFVKVVQAGSFSEAARRLGVPVTTVSAKVARLEKRLGVTLIQRTTRRLNVTPAGQAYYERSLRGLQEIEAAEAEVTAAGEPRGTLRITAPGDIAHTLLLPIVGTYLSRYPLASVELLVTNRVVDLVAEGVDLALRAATALRDSRLVARRLVTFCGALYASRAYLEGRRAPRTPAEQREHRCIVFPRLAGQRLRLTDGRTRTEVKLEGHLAADDLETVRACVRQGAGIAALPDFLARDGAGNEGFVRVLPRWTWETGALALVYPQQRFVPAGVRAFIDTAVELVRRQP